MAHSKDDSERSTTPTNVNKCKNCNGSGTEIVDMGGPDVEVTCYKCNGTGLEIS